MAEIVSKEAQPLLGRTTFTATTSFEGVTPDRNTVRKDVAKALGEKEEHVIIKHINTSFGGGRAEIVGAIYKKHDDAAAVEHKSLMAKHAKKEEPKAEEAAEETKEAPAPAEEKKDEAPAEEKQE